MSIRQRVLGGTAGAAAMLPFLLAGCVSLSGGEAQSTRVSDNFQVYAPFDNERDWGPSYLVGAPAHHFGDETRVDDTRSVPRDSGASPADPKGPPVTGAPPDEGSAPPLQPPP
jgi:hypothetical protein